MMVAFVYYSDLHACRVLIVFKSENIHKKSKPNRIKNGLLINKGNRNRRAES